MRLRGLVRNFRGRRVPTAKLLLDTTYLLPIFGVSVKLKDYNILFPKLINKYSILYNPASLVEAKWIIIGLSRRKPSLREALLNRFREGLRAILNDTRISQTVLTNSEVEEIADELLLRYRVNDYFDRIIYATAVYYNTMLLTEDRELHNLLKNKEAPKPREVIRWEDIIKRL